MDEKGSDLRITLDLPQLFTAHSISKSEKDLMIEIFNAMKSIRHNIFGIHLWGKKENNNGRRVAHIGDLNSYFMYDLDYKKTFLEYMFDTFNDGIDRYFVPEVNSGREDLVSIVNDLRNEGFKFIWFILWWDRFKGKAWEWGVKDKELEQICINIYKKHKQAWD